MLSAYITLSVKWLNDNVGVVSLLVFLVTAFFGWASGIFAALRRRPKFKVTVILDGPTLCCTFPIGERHGAFDMHRTAIALYLKISNIGSASSSIDNISIGYHWHLALKPFRMQWLQYTVGWFWLTDQSVVLADFQSKIGEHIKVYPYPISAGSLNVLELTFATE